MGLPTILTIIIALFVLFLIYRITKRIIFTIILFSFLITALLAVFSFFIYSDFKNFEKGMSSGEKLILLSKEDKILAGISLIDLEENSPKEVLNKQRLDVLSQNYKDKDYNEILGNKFKLIIIDIRFFEMYLEDSDLEENGEQVLTRQQALDILRDDESLQEYFESEFEGATDNPYELRTLLFITAFSKIIENKSPLFLFEEYKKSTIMVYEDSIMLKILRNIPAGILDKIADK